MSLRCLMLPSAALQPTRLTLLCAKADNRLSHHGRSFECAVACVRSSLHYERSQTYFLLIYSLYASYQCLSALSCLDFLPVRVKLPLHNDFVFNIGLGFRPVLGLFCLLFCALPGSVTLGSGVQRCYCTVVRCLLVVWTSFGLLVLRAY